MVSATSTIEASGDVSSVVTTANENKEEELRVDIRAHASLQRQFTLYAVNASIQLNYFDTIMRTLSIGESEIVGECIIIYKLSVS